MKLKLDYKIDDLETRKKIVEEICLNHHEELTERNLESLADYLIISAEREERRKRRILTRNRLATINKREVSFEGLVSKFENGEDGVYQLMTEDKNVIMTPRVTITKRDLEEIPFLKQIREAIRDLRGIEKKDYIIQQAIIDLSQQQYVVRNAYRKPIQFNSVLPPERVEPEWVELVDFKNWRHVAALLRGYGKLKTKVCDEVWGSMYWVLVDLEGVIERALAEEYPMLRDILIGKVEGLSNDDIQEGLEVEYGESFSVEYISSLFNNKIPKLIAEQAEKEELLWYYMEVEKGSWKKCNRCGEVKLLHRIFFSKNNSSKNGFYSICKECRNKKEVKSDE